MSIPDVPSLDNVPAPEPVGPPQAVPSQYAPPPGAGASYGSPYGAALAVPGAVSGQAPTYELASPGTRLLGLMLNGGLSIVTLGIGWLIWAIVLLPKGTDPAKSLLKMHVIDSRTGQRAGGGKMALRYLVDLVFAVLSSFTFGLLYLVNSLMVLGSTHQRLTDRVASTLVVKS